MKNILIIALLIVIGCGKEPDPVPVNAKYYYTYKVVNYGPEKIIVWQTPVTHPGIKVGDSATFGNEVGKPTGVHLYANDSTTVKIYYNNTLQFFGKTKDYVLQ